MTGGLGGPGPAPTAISGEFPDVGAEELLLRRLLWLRHGCTGLYGDDGEMQCGQCLLDFRRMSARDIERRFFELGLANAAKIVERAAPVPEHPDNDASRAVRDAARNLLGHISAAMVDAAVYPEAFTEAATKLRIALGTYDSPVPEHAPPTCTRCGIRPCMEQMDDSYGHRYLETCGWCSYVGERTERLRLERMRDAVLACLILAPADVKGAVAALTLERDDPAWFDRTTWNTTSPDQDAIAREIHAAWRDYMLRQNRPVSPERMTWEALPEADRELDHHIATRVALLVRGPVSGTAPPPEPSALSRAIGLVKDCLRYVEPQAADRKNGNWKQLVAAVKALDAVDR